MTLAEFRVLMLAERKVKGGLPLTAEEDDVYKRLHVELPKSICASCGKEITEPRVDGEHQRVSL